MFTLKNILKLILRNTLVSLAVVFISIVGIIVISKKINNISSVAVSNHRLDVEQKREANVFETFNTDVQIIGTNYTNIENAFIPSDNILGFINTLDNLLNTNVVKQVYNFETPIDSTVSGPFSISTISYSDGFVTNFSNFSNYLKEFEKLPYFTKIDNFSISSQDKNGWLGASNISFRATLYTKTIQ